MARDSPDAIWLALGDYRGPYSFRAFTRYLVARRNREIIEQSYRAYVTDSLRLLPQMSYLTTKWRYLIEGRVEPERTAQEIIDDVTSRLEAD